MHRYTPHYARHFSGLRGEKLVLIELGIGGYARERQGGASLRMWRWFFPRAQVVGVDIEDKSFVNQPRIQAFQGSLLLISHDRALLDAVGSRTVAVEDGTLHSYVGGWPEYLRVRGERADAERTAKRAKPAPPPKPKPAEPSKNQQRQAKRLEAEIEAAERALRALEQELADPDAWNDPR